MTFTATKLLSFEEYLVYEDEKDTRYELVDGQLEPMNPPTFRHLFISKYVEQRFDSEIKQLSLPWCCFCEAGVRKRSEYAALMIPEYWIVDPLESKVSVLILNEGLCEETVFVGSQVVGLKMFPELQLMVE